MLNVFGLIVIPSEPQLKIAEGNKGSFFNLQVVSPDEKKVVHRYSASMWVPTKEVDEWKEKLVPGNIFHITAAKWAMREYDGGKYPIPQLTLDRYHLKKLVGAWWIESEEDE